MYFFILFLLIHKSWYKSSYSFPKSTLINATCSLRFDSGEKRRKINDTVCQKSWVLQKENCFFSLFYYLMTVFIFNSELFPGFCKCHPISQKHCNNNNSILLTNLFSKKCAVFVVHQSPSFFLFLFSHEARKNCTQSPKREEFDDTWF